MGFKTYISGPHYNAIYDLPVMFSVVKVMLIDKNSYHRVQAAEFSEGTLSS